MTISECNQLSKELVESFVEKVTDGEVTVESLSKESLISELAKKISILSPRVVTDLLEHLRICLLFREAWIKQKETTRIMDRLEEHELLLSENGYPLSIFMLMQSLCSRYDQENEIARLIERLNSFLGKK